MSKHLDATNQILTHPFQDSKPPLSPYYFCLQTLPRLLQERDRLKEALKGAQEAEHQARALAQMAREERDVAKGDEGRLRAQRDRAVEESRRVRAEKEQLQSRVALLQERCEHLARRVRSGFPFRFLLNFAAVKPPDSAHLSASRLSLFVRQRGPSFFQTGIQTGRKNGCGSDGIAARQHRLVLARG